MGGVTGLGVGVGGPPAGAARRGPPLPSIVTMTGTGPAASAGRVSVRWMAGVASGYAELSMCPTIVLVTRPAAVSTLVVSHVMGGVPSGILP